jgi:hypothetical protein
VVEKRRVLRIGFGAAKGASGEDCTSNLGIAELVQESKKEPMETEV